jgi:two-component system response regulator AlgR
MSMKVLVVDDEYPARERLAGMLAELDQAKWQLAGTAENGQQAVEFFRRTPVDIVLLDIRMPVMDGLEAAALLATEATPPAIIFTTAFGEYALDAFNVNGTAYLLKPIKKTRLLDTLERIQKPNRAQMVSVQESPEKTAYLSGSYRGGIQRVAIDEVICLQAEQKYVVACSRQREILLDTPLKLLEEKFPRTFIRVHRNALVARNRILALEKNADGLALLVLRDTERKLEVSRRHLPSVRKILKDQP